MYYEPAKEVPVAEETDVLVAGGGPAGVAAAVAAARTGARVRLLEVHGCLGGVWTAGLLSWTIDVRDKPGILDEIISALDRGGYRAAPRPSGNHAYDPEGMKLVLEAMCLAAGVKVQLHTQVCAVGRGAGDRLAFVLTESKSGRQAWKARAFIDCTGDGDLAAQAGCGFDVGHPQTGKVQPLTLECLVMGLNAKDMEPYVCGDLSEPKKRLRADMIRGGNDPSYAAPVLMQIRDDLYNLGANHEYGVSAADAAQISDATIRARAELHRIVDGLRSLGGPWKDIRIVATAEQIGIREGRRIRGIYTVTVDDMLAGARFDDGVCRVHFGIDVHSPDPKKSRDFDHGGHGRTKPYDIPLRSLIAKDAGNLLMAGRCISGDFFAHSSYRVCGNAVAMGQAAGVAAALAAKADCAARDVPWADVAAGIERVKAASAAAAKGEA